MVTIQSGPNSIVSVSENNFSHDSRDKFFAKMLAKSTDFGAMDTFEVGEHLVTGYKNLVDYLKSKKEKTRITKKSNDEEDLLDTVDCEKCDGSGDTDKKERSGDFIPCPYCNGSGSKNVWGKR